MATDSVVQAAADFAVSAGGHHGAAQGPFDLVLVAVMISVVWLVVIRSVVYFLRPGETSADHIKRRVLE
ncbi:MAG TPA: hypothetical protein VFS33_02755 [Gemmatimonadales bacterium]|nr:hypothetical protein [Gemmatimonadales bacterium]